MFVNVLVLVLGFVLLLKGADYFVEGSSSLARLLRVPSAVIGLTLVAMGTSAPEAAVSISASLSGNNAIALSNVLGSNLFNLLVVLGVCALLKPVPVEETFLRRHLPLTAFATALLLFFCRDQFLSRWEGLCFLTLLALYLISTVREALASPAQPPEEEPLPLWKSALFVAGGLAAVVWGGDLVVDNASALATALGVSQNVIGLTIVAMGTSLPELVTSITAAHKGDSSLALGNVIGSNLFNILFILGASCTLSPLSVLTESWTDLALMLGTTLLAWLYCRSKKSVSRWEGGSLAAIYAVYLCTLLLR